jgi:hypothetical protein
LDINGQGVAHNSIYQTGTGASTYVYGDGELLIDPTNGGNFTVDQGSLTVEAGQTLATRGFLVLGNLTYGLVFGSTNTNSLTITSGAADGAYARIDGNITMTSKTTLTESGDPGGILGYIKDAPSSGAPVIAIGSATLSISDAVGAAVKNGFTPFSITTTATTGITGSFGSLSDTAGKTLTNPANPTNNAGTWTYPITVT